jgi:hypothetical protein
VRVSAAALFGTALPPSLGGLLASCYRSVAACEFSERAFSSHWTSRKPTRGVTPIVEWLDCQLSMPQPVAERIKKLRDEIAEINQANRPYWRDPRYGSAVADNERRLQRLLEIVEEMKSLTDWKKL